MDWFFSGGRWPPTVAIMGARAQIRPELVDEMIDLYCDWRTASAEVQAAYDRFCDAPPSDRLLAFAAYTAALAAPHADGLAEALARNVFAGCSGPERATRLAAYCRETLRQLNTQGELTCGEVSFPDPQQVGVHA